MYNKAKELRQRDTDIRYLLYIALIILSISVIMTVIIIYNNHLKKIYMKNFEKECLVVKNDVNLILNSKIIISRLISNRTRIYQTLEDYNNGKVSLKYLNEFSIPKLKDSFTAERAICALKRFDINKNPVIIMGDIFPDKKIDFKREDAYFLSSFFYKGGFYLSVVSPVYNGEKRRIGTDLVVFNFKELKSVLKGGKDKKYSGIFNIVLKEKNKYYKLFKDNINIKDKFLNNKSRAYVKKGNEKYLLFYSKLKIPETYFYGAYDIDSLNKMAMKKGLNMGFFAFIILLVFNIAVYFYIVIRQKNIFKKANEYIEKEKEEKRILDTYLNLAPELFVVLDKEGNISYLNKYGYKILEIENEDIIGKNWFDNFIPENVRENVKKVFKSIRAKNFNKFSSYDNEIITKQNKIKYIRWYNSFIEDEKGGVKYVIAVGSDITLQKRKDDELKLLGKAIEQAPVSVVITNPAGDIEYVNPFFTQLTEYEFDEVLGKNPRILKSGEHNEAFYKNLWETITSGETWVGEFHNKKKNGKLYWEKAVIGPVIDDKGNILNFVGIKEDITELKEMKEHFYNIQKLESLGTLAGGIAHDMNNILYAIGGYAEIMKRKIDKNSVLKKYIDSIEKSMIRAKNLVDQILSFSRYDTHKDKENIELESTLKKSVKFMKDIVPSYINIIFDYRSKFKYIFANKTKLHQIIMNLITNSKDAIGDKHGEIRIIVDDIDKDMIIKKYPIKEKYDNYIRMVVSDNGSGIPEEIKDRIFDPFFTTKQKGKGTGLGLSTVFGHVKDLNGIIDVESKVGEGTTFTIYFPVVNISGKKSEKREKIRTEDLKGNERILFVDDEEQVADAIGEGLRDFGYDVMAVTSSYEALNLFKNNPNIFDIVITDQTMPELTGEELGKEILKIRKDIPIILCTGYSDSIDREKAIKIGFKKFVFKPTTSLKLALIIREIFKEDNK